MESTKTIITNTGFKTLKIFIGGGIVSHSIRNESIIEIFLITILIIIIKSFIVMICYNTIIPRLLTSYDKNYDPNNFYKINIWESLLLILLFSNLFGRY
jgi:hypothetical protein